MDSSYVFLLVLLYELFKDTEKRNVKCIYHPRTQLDVFVLPIAVATKLNHSFTRCLFVVHNTTNSDDTLVMILRLLPFFINQAF